MPLSMRQEKWSQPIDPRQDSQQRKEDEGTAGSLVFDKVIRKTLFALSFTAPIGIIFSYFNAWSLSPNEYSSLRLLFGIGFLNSSHVALTALMMFLVPEIRGFAQIRLKTLAVWSTSIVLATLALSVARYVVNSDIWFDAFILRPILVITTIHHSILQTHGIFRQTHSPLAELACIREMLKPWLLTMIGFAAAGFFLQLTHQNLALRWLIGGSVLVWLLGAIWILRNTPKGDRIDVLQYLNRHFCYAVCYLSPTITILMLGFHGLEYLLVSRTILNRSSTPNQNRKFFWWLFFLWNPICVLIYHFRFFMPAFSISNESAGSLTLILLTMGNIFTYVHYGMDHLIFKFSDPVVRLNLGPLFRTSVRQTS